MLGGKFRESLKGHLCSGVQCNHCQHVSNMRSRGLWEHKNVVLCEAARVVSGTQTSFDRDSVC